MISTKLENAIRDIADFPSYGIVFKDITPILKDVVLFAARSSMNLLTRGWY